jgi:probable H4MPT-linked C1 transfer pathway protein
VRSRSTETNVMNEWFATSADIYRLTHELDAAHDQHDTADHRGKDRASTCARLARMIGRDAADGSEDDWLDLARTFRGAQLRWIEHGVSAVLAAGTLPVDAPVVAAGCGAFLACEIADRLGRRCVEFDRLLDVAGPAARWARVCAPSAAVALLAAADRALQSPRFACGS